MFSHINLMSLMFIFIYYVYYVYLLMFILLIFKQIKLQNFFCADVISALKNSNGKITNYYLLFK